MHSDSPLLEVRRSVRRALRALGNEPAARGAGGTPPLVLAALSGGADSLALAAALATECGAAGVRGGALIIDHGLQSVSAGVALAAATTARELGLDPVLVRRVDVAERAADGPEAAARAARYAAFAAVAEECGARAVLTGHTRTDQAEQVLLGLARGSGMRSLAGIPARRALTAHCLILRPFLVPEPEVTRETTAAACARLGLTPWQDPHNSDPAFARVRVRERVLPLWEAELGPGVAAALARTADLAAEDAEALDLLARDAWHRASGNPGEAAPGPDSASVLDVDTLAELPTALRNRVLRLAAAEHGAHLGRGHTGAIAALVTDWRGQGPAFVPGLRVSREGGTLVFRPQHGSPRTRGARPGNTPG